MAVASGTTAAFSVRPAAAPGGRHCAYAAAATGGARFRADVSGGGKWWAPLLGWSAQPDYIDALPAPPAPEEEMPTVQPARARRFGLLTEEKARQLRMRMKETENFHDAMYHSAIASRLASVPPDHDAKAP